jgi:GTPase Era involved in 16S rRNA processing
MAVLPKIDFPGLLDQTIERLCDLGTGFSREIDALKGLKKRLEEGRFHLAILGQFKRGKSSLLNALLGENILPTAVIPLTAIPTFIQAGHKRQAKIVFSDKKPSEEYTADNTKEFVDFLSKYVAETNNPANELNVQQVEVSHPAEILSNGVVLIDTPGIGSTFKHNTEATLNFLPQCDAAMFLVSADPPITEVEIEFLKQVQKKVPHLFFTLNKIDYLTEQEKDEILSFVKKVLGQQVGIEKKIDVFCVSARLGSQAKKSNDVNLWLKSGLDKIQEYLIDFLSNEKAEALQQAVRRKSADILAEVLMGIQISVKSLQIPLDDLEQKLRIFTEKLTELEHSKLSESDILDGDKKRTHEFLEEHAEKLRQKSRSYLKGILEETFSKLDSEQLSEDVIEKVLAEEIPGFFEHEMGKSTGIFQDKMQQVLGPHRERMNKLIGSIRQSAAELFDIPYRQALTTQDFEMTKRPYWVSHRWARSFQRIPRGIFDKLLPHGARRSQLVKKAVEQINELVMQNVENLRWAVFQNIDHSFIRFRSELGRQFEQTVIATRGAIEAALKKRKEHTEIVTDEIKHLQESLKILTNIKESLEPSGNNKRKA